MTDQEEPKEDGEEMLEENVRGEELPEKMQDPRVTQEEEIEQFEAQITSLHDMADQVKQVGQDVSEMLMKKAEEAEDDELRSEYMKLAEASRQAYRRVEFGDSTIVRNGL